MKKRIYRATLITSVLVLVVAFALTTRVLYGHFSHAIDTQLEIQLKLAVHGVEVGGEDFLRSLADENYRLTLVNSDGAVVFDTAADSSGMDNHLDREEIKEAIQTGSGKSERFSRTLLKKTINITQKLSNGEILRISTTQRTLIQLVLKSLWPLLAVFAFAAMLSMIAAKRVSDRIVEPLNRLDMENPSDNDEVYDELAPLLLHIEKQNEKIDMQVKELKQRQEEFSAVTENMNEGLVMLGNRGNVLAINKAAMKIFSADKKCIGRPFIETERDVNISEALANAMTCGAAEVHYCANGREYQVNISGIGRGNDRDGAAMLIFDVTDKVFAERNRREFTANVSHELKTPLQSISGSAELIENGLVKPEDIPSFISNIRSESARLISLIDDIIKLSRLDEKTEMKYEKIDLYELAVKTAEGLKSLADKKKVSITVGGQSVFVQNAGRLVWEITFNLLENAVKYNKEYGTVIAEVIKGDDCAAVLRVKDSGIGVPAEDLHRIFERFYRVDKSHSQETGGTGLGLSIVKHAAEYLGAEIDIQSEYGVGTEVTVKFKN